MSALSRASLFLVIVVAVSAFIAGVYVAMPTPRAPGTPEIEGLLWPDPPRLSTFSLSDADGAVFDAQRLDGHWTLLFFGFTHCPDICPGTLATLKLAYARLQAQPEFAAKGQVVFVSVDPARDTPATLGSYVRHFNPAFLAATGTEAALTELTRQLGILHARIQQGDGDYTIDHTASIILIGPQRERLAVFSAPHDPASIAERVTRIIDFLKETV